MAPSPEHALAPGRRAPDVTLLDQHGEPFKLSSSIKQHKARYLVCLYL